MMIDDLQAALDGLSTERLQRLVDHLEREPDIEVSVGTWRPQCPMVLAGFDPQDATSNMPEHWFAAVWDRVAAPDPKRRLRLPFARRTARHADVQLLLRGANAVLAHRDARDAVAHELEHIRKHVAAIAAICKTAGLSLGHARAESVMERLMRLNAAAPGHRYLLGAVCPGGVMRAPETAAMRAALLRIPDELHNLVGTAPATTSRPVALTVDPTHNTATRFDPAVLARIQLMVHEVEEAVRRLRAQLDRAAPEGRPTEQAAGEPLSSAAPSCPVVGGVAA